LLRLISPIQPVSGIDEILLETAAGFIKLLAYSEDIVRVRFATRPEFSDKPSLMIVPDARRPAVLNVSDAGEAIIVSTAKVSIQINRMPGIHELKIVMGDSPYNRPALCFTRGERCIDS
jgi:hypothetical protein